MFLIYLLVSNTLPDDVGGQGVDLKIYYFQNHGTFWGLMSAVILMSALIGIIKRFQVSQSFNVDEIAGSLIFTSLTGSLAVIKRQGYHSIIVCCLVLEVILEIFSK